MNGARRFCSGAGAHDCGAEGEAPMRKHVRAWIIAGLVALAAAPALAGSVASMGPALHMNRE